MRGDHGGKSGEETEELWKAADSGMALRQTEPEPDWDIEVAGFDIL